MKKNVLVSIILLATFLISAMEDTPQETAEVITEVQKSVEEFVAVLLAEQANKRLNNYKAHGKRPKKHVKQQCPCCCSRCSCIIS